MKFTIEHDGFIRTDEFTIVIDTVGTTTSCRMLFEDNNKNMNNIPIDHGFLAILDNRDLLPAEQEYLKERYGIGFSVENTEDLIKLPEDLAFKAYLKFINYKGGSIVFGHEVSTECQNEMERVIA